MQFRLVDYKTVKVDASLFRNRTSPDHFALQRIWNATKEQVGDASGMVRAFFAPVCTNADNVSAYPGQSLPESSVACTSFQLLPSTLAHELGHVVMANNIHDDVAADNLMASLGGGRTLTREQCQRAREHLANWIRFPNPR